LRVEEWEGLRGYGSEQEKRRGGKDGGMGGEGKEGDFQKFEILTSSMLCSANLHYRAKFRTGRSSRSGNFNCPYPSEGLNASSCQIFCKSVHALRRNDCFRFFKMAVVRHLGFSKVGNLNCRYPSESQDGSSCQILCKSVKALLRYGRFLFCKMAAVRHLGFVIRLFGPPTKCILVVSVTVQNLV